MEYIISLTKRLYGLRHGKAGPWPPVLLKSVHSVYAAFFRVSLTHVSCHVRLPPGRGLLRPVCQEAEPDREEGVAADEAEKLVSLDGGVAVGVMQGEGRLHLVRVAVGRGLGLGLGFLGWALGFQGRLHELLDESICRELRGAAVVEGGARKRRGRCT